MRNTNTITILKYRLLPVWKRKYCTTTSFDISSLSQWAESHIKDYQYKSWVKGRSISERDWRKDGRRGGLEQRSLRRAVVTTSPWLTSTQVSSSLLVLIVFGRICIHCLSVFRISSLLFKTFNIIIYPGCTLNQLF